MAKADMGYEVIRAKFNPGTLLMTESISDTVSLDDDFAAFVLSSVMRHINADWGDVCADDKISNFKALQNDERLLSAYHLDEIRIYVLTEADRSNTMVLFPDEY